MSNYKIQLDRPGLLNHYIAATPKGRSFWSGRRSCSKMEICTYVGRAGHCA